MGSPEEYSTSLLHANARLFFDVAGVGRYNAAFFGQLAQLVEQRTENPRVRGSIPRLATRIQRPTVLGWAFSFVLPASHAGFPLILRVRPGSCGLAGTSPVALRSALSSLEIGANFFAVAHADSGV